MVFSSHVFLFLFLPLVLAVYYLAPRRLRNGVLLGFSLLFYGWASPLFAGLLILTVGVCYVAGLWVAQRRESKWPRRGLWLGVGFPLLVLGFFKYFNFARDNWNALVQQWGVAFAELDLALQIILPLGLSFYTFQAISYVVDIHRGECRPQKNPLNFACYIALFPQLVAGPIVRYGEIERQLGERAETFEKFSRGIAFFMLGFAKKILLANPCGELADVVFTGQAVSTLDAWIGVFGYSMQIYFDFSGYSDMAIGLGLMFGFVFPVNFNAPYRSVSITDFWRRWHISLSSFLRDYLYIPLGGNRKGAARTYVNLMIVMLLGGLWHGSAWTFVCWGAFHGLLLARERFAKVGKRHHKSPRILRVGLTFVLVCFGWVFFRSESLGDAWVLFQSMMGTITPSPSSRLLEGWLYRPFGLIVLGIAFSIVWWAPASQKFLRRVGPWKAVWIVFLFLLGIVAMTNQAFNPFIYFNF